ncbi:hypothetical protein ACWDOP_21795 [Nocardia sp. NPDC003693]
MSSGYHRPDADQWSPDTDRWTQDTDVFEPVRDAQRPMRDGYGADRDAYGADSEGYGYGAPGDGYDRDPGDYGVDRGDAAPGSPRGRRQPPRKRSTAELAGLGALGVVVLVLLAVGTFLTTRHFMGSDDAAPTAAPTETAATTAPPVTTTSKSNPPAAGAALSTVITWVKAGTAVDAADFHTATTTEGVTSDLGSAIAFASPSGKLRCMTPKRANPNQQGLTCLADLDNPPERPAKAQGNWVGNWIDYPGATLGVGRMQGDPGQFLLGDGPTLAYGSRITFDGYDCRMDEAGLFCVNETAETAVRLSSSGPVGYGCLSEYTSKEYGLWYSCEAPLPTTTSATKSTTPQPTTTRPGQRPGSAVAGQRCSQYGQRSTGADGSGLMCDTAPDGLRWFVE